MFIELAEHLACPVGHDEQAHCILIPDEIVDRMVVRGTVACPICRTEFPVANGIVRFGDPSFPEATGAVPSADIVQALLDLSGPGGYVVLLGSAAVLAEELASLQPGVHMVTVNDPQAENAKGSSCLYTEEMIPLRNRVACGVVVGSEYTTAVWLSDAARVLLRGRRLVGLDNAPMPEGVDTLVTGDGVTVGENRR
ncbi:MAG: hypothetical protein V3T56_08985 [Gemmatimonadales bacterium]